MKKLLIAIVLCTSVSAFAQKHDADACTFLTTAQINSLLGTKVDDLPAGPSAFYLTGADWAPLVRFKCTVGNYFVTFDTRKVDQAKVIAKLPEIFKTIKANLGVQ